MPAVPISVADAITAMLVTASASLSQPIEPQRSYADWSIVLKDEDRLLVDVVPVYHKQRVDLASRGKLKFTVPVDVCIRKRIEESEQQDENGRAVVSVVDDLLLLSQEIFELFIPERLTSYTVGAFKSAEPLLWPDIPHLKKKQFTALIRTTFQVEKAIA